MTETRSYRQNCGLARALDLVGERWTLLIVRELARGAKRFRDLDDALPGIGANLLAARLKRLQAADVAHRVELAPGVRAYALTERGDGLAHALGELVLWGLDLPDMLRPEDETRAAWLAMSMQISLDRAGESAPDGTYAFTVGQEAFWLHVGGGRSQLRDGPPPYPPDASLSIAPHDFYAVAVSGTLDAIEATCEGDRERLDQLFRTFRIPAVPTGALA